MLAAGVTAMPHRTDGAAGDLDRSFGAAGTGWVQVAEGITGAEAMALQADGKILTVGHLPWTDGLPQLTVWRFNADGSADTSFGDAGRATAVVQPDMESHGFAVALRSDGRIVAGGLYRIPPNENIEDPDASIPNNPRFLLAGFLPDGRPDPAFGPGGTVATSASGEVHVLALQPDGKILAGGSGAFIYRYLTDGTPDAAFGDGGQATPPGYERCFAFAVQTDGKILAARDSANGVITRLLPGGLTDTSFGSLGNVTLFPAPQPAESMRAERLTVSSDGRILAAGGFHLNNGGTTHEGFFLARLLPDGTPDPAFGEAATPGRSRASFGYMDYASAAAIHVQSDGHVLVSGLVSRSATRQDIALVRFTPGGLPDSNFGNAGTVRTDLFGNGSESIRGAGLMADSRLVVAGYSWAPGGPSGGNILLARYQAPLAVSLTVELPGGNELRPDSGAVDFGPVPSGTRVMPLTVRNTGLTTLTNLQAALTDESHTGAYQHSTPAATLAPGAQTSVIVSLTPGAAAGIRTASLRFTAGNTDPALTPRVIPLTGSKATGLQIWRVTWFGSPDNSGPGADMNDFDHDGLPNLMEYALGTHPHNSSPAPCQPSPEVPGAFLFKRPAVTLTEFSWQPERASSAEGPWSAENLTSTVLAEEGGVQTVLVTPVANDPPAERLFLRLRITKL